MKVSFISTVYNEEKTIDNFFNSIKKQTQQPYEIIIVDAGSTDKTVEKLKKIQTRIKLPLKLIIKYGNRSVGRNEAIRQARGDIIVCSDAGCSLDIDWLKNIAKPFSDRKIDVVSGYYLPETRNIFEKCLSVYTCVMPDKIDKQNFFPSSRSIAFKKSSWKKVYGYPEHLDTCEDLVFDRRLKSAGFNFFFAENALVYWTQRKNFFQAFQQFFSYALGDGQARYIRPQTPFLFLRYVLGLGLVALAMFMKLRWLWILLFAGLIFYILWAIKKNYGYIKNPKAFFYLPVLQFMADVAVLFGTAIGFLRSVKLVQGTFFFLFSLWVIFSFFAVFYNTFKLIPEIKEWMFLSDYEKRYKIFGDIYSFFLFVENHTESDAEILIYSKDVRTFYLGIYYLYPRRITVIGEEKKIFSLAKKQTYSCIGIYKSKVEHLNYEKIATYISDTDKNLGGIYKLKSK